MRHQCIHRVRYSHTPDRPTEPWLKACHTGRVIVSQLYINSDSLFTPLIPGSRLKEQFYHLLPWTIFKLLSWEHKKEHWWPGNKEVWFPSHVSPLSPILAMPSHLLSFRNWGQWHNCLPQQWHSDLWRLQFVTGDNVLFYQSTARTGFIAVRVRRDHWSEGTGQANFFWSSTRATLKHYHLKHWKMFWPLSQQGTLWL